MPLGCGLCCVLCGLFVVTVIVLCLMKIDMRIRCLYTALIIRMVPMIVIDSDAGGGGVGDDGDGDGHGHDGD